LRRAADIKDKVQSLESELSRILDASHAVSTAAAKPKRKMSAAARAKIAAGQRARWAKVKGSKSAMALVLKPKRQMSAAAKAKISAAAKARWAKVRAAKK
jgi:uncharacterized protein YoxC